MVSDSSAAAAAAAAAVPLLLLLVVQAFPLGIEKCIEQVPHA